MAPVRETNIEVENQVRDQINTLFDDVAALAVADPPETTPHHSHRPHDLPRPQPKERQPLSHPSRRSSVGLVFLDTDGDGEFLPDAEVARPDRGLEGVTIQVPVGGEVETVVTGADGVWSLEVPAGQVVLGIDAGDAQIPRGYLVGTENLNQLVECDSGSECTASPIGFEVNLRPIEEITGRDHGQSSG